MPRTYLPIMERLARLSMPEPNSGCHLWLGAVSGWGNGMVRWKGKMRIAPRVAWECHNGVIPEGLLVLHKCDVPACINPDHLFLGTNAENKMDCVRKGRHKHVLSASQIMQIRVDARSHATIAAEHGVAASSIGRVKNRQSWGHV